MSNNLSNVSLSELTSFATCLQLPQGQTPLISSWLNFKHFIWYQRAHMQHRIQSWRPLTLQPSLQWSLLVCFLFSDFLFCLSDGFRLVDSAISSPPSRRRAPPPEVRSSLASPEVPGSSSDIELGQPSSPLLPVSDAVAGAVPPGCDRLAPSLSPEVELSPSLPGFWTVMSSLTVMVGTNLHYRIRSELWDECQADGISVYRSTMRSWPASKLEIYRGSLILNCAYLSPFVLCSS